MKNKALTLFLLLLLALGLYRMVATPAPVLATYEECEEFQQEEGEEPIVDTEACRKRFREEHPNANAPATDATAEEWKKFLDEWKEDHNLSDETYCALLGNCNEATPSPTITITSTSTMVPPTPTATVTITSTSTTVPPTPTATVTITSTSTTVPPTPTATVTITSTSTTVPPTSTATATIVATSTTIPSTPKPERENTCLRINFDLGGHVARQGRYIVQETGGHVVYSGEMGEGWMDTGWIRDLQISYQSVYVQVLFYNTPNAKPTEMEIVNPAPDTTYGWLSWGMCHALEVRWPVES